MTTTHDYIGEASFGNDRPKRNWENANWKVTEAGPNIYRVLPPFGSLAATGKWAYYESIIWGFKGTNGKQKPFRSILKKNRKGMIEQDDPAITWIMKVAKKKADRLEELKADVDSGKITKEEAAAKVQPLTDFLDQYRNEKFFTLNVMRPDGAIGKLKIKIRLKQALDALFQELIENEGVNPIKPDEGVWVNFKRTGQMRDTQYSCEAVYDVITEGKKRMKTLRPAPLTEEHLERMKTESFDLAVSFRSVPDGYDGIKRMVDSEGDPEVVDSVFGAKVTESSYDSKSFVDEDTAGGDAMDAEAVMSSLKKSTVSKSTKPPMDDNTKKILEAFSSDSEDAPF